MRKETQKVVGAFLRREAANGARTWTDGRTLELHGNAIAWWSSEGLHMTLAGWGTTTTRERLNGIMEMMGDDRRFVQRDHCQFLYSHLSEVMNPIDTDQVITLPLDVVTARLAA